MCAAALLLALSAACGARADEIPAQPTGPVMDLAGVIDPASQHRLFELIAGLERSTQAQLRVLVINTTGGRPINDVAVETAQRWRLGRSGHDDGVLVLLAVADRAYFISVGYGLEPVLTDRFCGAVARQHFVPHFRSGRYGQGLFFGAHALAQRIAEARGVELPGFSDGAPMPKAPVVVAHTGQVSPVCSLLCMVAIIALGLSIVGGISQRQRGYRRWGGAQVPWWVWLMVFSALSNRRGRRRNDWWGSGGWGSGSGWGGLGGGGGGGGGFGGGWGGGGGTFGGGGAGGRW